MRGETALISKREYTEDQIPRDQMGEYLQAFNRVRPESARLDTEPDGQKVLLVRGWMDSDAAALMFLLRGGTKPQEITAALLEHVGPCLDIYSTSSHLLGVLPDAGIDPFSDEPSEPSLTDVSDLALPSQTPVEEPETRPSALCREHRLLALVSALAVVTGLSEEQALRHAIEAAARKD